MNDGLPVGLLVPLEARSIAQRVHLLTRMLPSARQAAWRDRLNQGLTAVFHSFGQLYTL
jgi:hypothetical protein